MFVLQLEDCDAAPPSRQQPPIDLTRSVTTENKHTSLFMRTIAVNALATGSLWLVSVVTLYNVQKIH